jgi:hypothetical protein
MTCEVYAAINAVQADLTKEGITKNRKNQQQGYSFRGIDDVFNALSPLMAKHGLCILPRILSRECVERQTAKGGTLFYVTVEAEFDFVSSKDASTHMVRTFGEAMDSADKATNKAMSAAYKYACLQAFAIPTEGDNDADAQTHHVQPPQRPAPPAPQMMTDAQRKNIMALYGDCPREERLQDANEILKAAKPDMADITSFSQLTVKMAAYLIDELQKLQGRTVAA